MASMFGYWAGLNAAENVRLDRDMWEIASRATRRPVPIPVDDRPALINQNYQLQAELQQARADSNANYQMYLAEWTAHQETKAELETVMRDWLPF